jgi:hypothetical protein
MPAVKYVGRASEGVTLAIDGVDTYVAHGATVDVPADVAAGLTRTSQWTRHATKKSTTTTPDTEE